jgi:hypothetical protein
MAKALETWPDAVISFRVTAACFDTLSFPRRPPKCAPTPIQTVFHTFGPQSTWIIQVPGWAKLWRASGARVTLVEPRRCGFVYAG